MKKLFLFFFLSLLYLQAYCQCSINIGPDKWSCGRGPVQLSSDSSGAQPIWSSDGTGYFTPSKTVPNPSYVPSALDIQKGIVKINVTSGRCVGSTSIHYSIPKVSFTATISGNLVNFIATTPAGFPSEGTYIWNFGDVPIVNNLEKTITHSYSAPGTYNVCVKFIPANQTTKDSCEANFCLPITIACPNEVQIQENINQNIVNVFGNATFINGPSIIPGTYTWDFGDHTNQVIGQNATHTYQNPGVYTVCVKFQAFPTAELAQPPCEIKSCKTITIKGCDASVSFSDSIVGKDATFFANSQPNIGEYRWEFGDGTTGTGSITNHHYTTAGTYNICVTYISTTSKCIATYCDTITILPQPCQSQVSFSNSIFGKDATFFASTATEDGSYEWNFGDGNVGTGKVVDHIYSTPGQYGVCVKFTSPNFDTGDSCEAFYCDTITISEPCHAQVSFTDSISGPDVAFIANTFGDNGMLQWDFGDGSIGAGSFVVHTYANPGQYNVCVKYITPSTNSLDSCFAFFCDTITIGDVCKAQIAFNDSITGHDAVFFANTFGNSGSIEWNFGDGTFATGDFTTHTYSAPGQYSVCVKFTSPSNFSLDSCFAFYCDTITIQDDPCNIHITYNDSIVGNEATFFANTFGASGIVQWNFGDGTFGFGEIVSHTYTSNGVYPVCVSLSTPGNNIDSCFAVFCDSIFISQPCHAEVKFSNTINGKNVLFTATASIGNYQWFFGDGTIASTAEPFISHAYTNEGDFSVCLQFTSFDSCTAWHCDTLQIQGCTTDVSINDSLVGRTVYLEGFTSTNNPGSYKWTFGDGKSASGKFVNHEYKKPGTYTICVAYKSKDGLCTMQECKTIEIKKCYVDVYFTKEVTGDTVTFNAFTSSDESGTYFWDLGDGTVMKGRSFSHIYKNSGKYIVTLSYYSKNNVCVCESVYSDTITIKVCPKIGFNTDIEGKTVTFTAYTNSSDSSMYYWEFGDGTYGFGRVVTHTFATAGSYNVTLDGYTHHGACQCLCSSTSSSEVVIVPTTCPNYTLIDKRVIGNQVVFTARNFPNPSTFSWSFGDGSTTTSSSPTITHTYLQNGVYHVKVTTSYLGVDTCQTISYDSVAIGMDTIQIEISLHPNPAVNVINFKLDTDKAAAVAYEIVNGMGTSLIKDGNIISGPNHHTVDVTMLPPGFYMLKITYDGQVFTKQFMKE